MPPSSTLLERSGEVIFEEPVRSMDLAEPLDGIFPLTPTEKMVDEGMHDLMVQFMKNRYPSTMPLRRVMYRAAKKLDVLNEVYPKVGF